MSNIQANVNQLISSIGSLYGTVKKKMPAERPQTPPNKPVAGKQPQVDKTVGDNVSRLAGAKIEAPDANQVLQDTANKLEKKIDNRTGRRKFQEYVNSPEALKAVLAKFPSQYERQKLMNWIDEERKGGQNGK